MSRTDRCPIAVFAYSRPDHLRLTLEALGRCEGFVGDEVTIFCDAPGAPRDEPGVERVRRLAREWVDAHGGALVLRETNLGNHNILQGITAMCETHGRVIIVEDDVVVSPDFLAYMRAGLDRYEDEERVYLISGQMYANDWDDRPQTFFLPIVLIWGWATWARAWSRFELDPPGWREMLADESRRREFDLGGAFPFSAYLERAMTGPTGAWDSRWGCTVFNAGGLALYPWRSLTWNSGCGCGAHGLSRRSIVDHRVDLYHGRERREDFRRPRLRSPLELPETVETDDHAYARLAQTLRRGRTLPRRLRRLAFRAVDLGWRSATG